MQTILFQRFGHIKPTAMKARPNLEREDCDWLEVNIQTVSYIKAVWRCQHKKANTNQKRICSQNMDNKGNESEEWLQELVNLRNGAIHKE